MQPTRETVTTRLTISGIHTRTTNLQEMNPFTAKIAPLWARLCSEGLLEKIPNRSKENSALYGVYSGYESDYMGAFDALAGAAVSKPTSDPAWRSIEIQAGDYLVFSAKGAMPQTVVQTWAAIWQFFQANPSIQRSYATDFELYRGMDEVAVYIGVNG